MADTQIAPPPLAAFAEALRVELGSGAMIDDAATMAPYLKEWRDLYRGVTPFVLRPANTQDVSTIVRLAAQYGIKVIPQGGNTGLVGGQIPTESGDEVLISLDRMNEIEEVDAAGNTMLVGSGVILADVQAAAEEADRLFPMSLASEGSARIGGLISTNAGGTGVLAYGNMRDQVLGLEVVMPNGQIWNGLRALHKDNVGYDLKHLFIGGEGTLGIITRAVLRLRPRPVGRDVAFVGLSSPTAALKLLNDVRGTMGDALTAFELIPKMGVDFVLEYGAGARNPFSEPLCDWTVLIEVSTFQADRPMRDPLQDVLMKAYEDGTVSDVVVAQSIADGDAFWRIRDLLSEVQGHAGGSIKHDVSVPVHVIPEFLDDAIAAALSVVPDARPLPFGHMGDGNIHFNVSQPVGADKAEFLSRWDEMAAAVHAVTGRYNGSIAAEHGVGRLKRNLLRDVRSPVELAMMRAVKDAFDPKGIMSPGRLLPDAN